MLGGDSHCDCHKSLAYNHVQESVFINKDQGPSYGTSCAYICSEGSTKICGHSEKMYSEKMYTHTCIHTCVCLYMYVDFISEK